MNPYQFSIMSRVILDAAYRFYNSGRGTFQYHSLRHRRGSGSIKQDMRFHAKLNSLLFP